MKIVGISFVLLLLLLSSCQPKATPTVDLPSPTSAVFTQIHESLDTPAYPTKTPTHSPSPPNPTISPQEIASTILKELIINKEESYSPNGMCGWERLLGFAFTEAASLKYNNQIYEYVTLSCGPGPKKWILMDEWAEGGLGYAVPALLGWSEDGKYLYFYDSHIPDGCQPPGGFQQNLRQVNLTNGNIVSIPVTLTGGIVLSPDTAKIAYYDHQSLEVGIYDIETGKEKRISFDLPPATEYWYAGDFTWSPDGLNVLFIIQYGDPCLPSGVSFRSINLANDQIVTLLEREDQAISIVEWKDVEYALITMEKKEYWLDPISGEVILAPVCPNDCVITQP